MTPLLGVWVIVVLLGFLWVDNYSNTGSLPVDLFTEIPALSAFRKDLGKPLLLVFIHPMCSCSRATLTELDRLAASLQDVKTYVVFTQPAGRSPAWVKNDLWDKATKMKGITPIIDGGGNEASIFKATTSGHTILFNSKGSQVYAGGLTAARGHVGEAVGQSIIKQWVSKRLDNPLFSKVFGCNIFGSSFK